MLEVIWFELECTRDPSACVCAAIAGFNSSGDFNIVEFTSCRLGSYFFLFGWISCLMSSIVSYHFIAMEALFIVITYKIIIWSM